MMIALGFLKALEDAGIKPDYISGCSMGAVVGGCYATGMDADAMMREVSALSATDILDPSINPIMDGAVFRAKKMRRKLKEYLKDYNQKLLVGELGSVYKYKNVDTDFSLNITNSYSVAFLHSIGVNKITLSHELNYK